MIEKIISIKNIGRFQDCIPSGDVAFRKLTLLFAENGQGKTTLCAILRSLQSGKPEFISERKTLGVSEQAAVQIRFDGNTVSFTNDSWSDIYSDINIFDSAFIHDNVYSGDYIDHEHKKNLYRIIVGSQGVRLAKQIEELDEKIREANKDINAKRAELEKFSHGVTLEQYLAWQPVENIETTIQEKTKEIAKRQRALDKVSDIQSKGLLTKIELPSFPSDFTTIIAKQLIDVMNDAEAQVRKQVAQHKMGDLGESWLSQGLGYVFSDLCPFCGQSVRDNDLIDAYRSYFNVAYKTLKEEVNELSQRISDAIGETSLTSTQQATSGNQVLAEFWKQFTEIKLPEFSIDEVLDKYYRLRQLSLELAKKKQENPTEAVSPGEDFTSVFKEVQDLQQSMNTYNTAVYTCNNNINKQKLAVQRGGNVNTLKGELANIEAKKKRFEPEVAKACLEFQEALKEKTKLGQQKDKVKQRLDQYCEGLHKTYQQDINNYLEQFNTGFRIANSRHLYTGGKTPSSHYQILINETAIDLGDSKTQSGIHCFRTTLSSGDRSALALAFFLAAIKQDPNISNKIVVLDDPITSLDRFRRTCTQQLIKQIANKAKQVIVLSHDSHFLKLVWDDFSPADRKTLQTYWSGGHTVIGEMDIESETQTVYEKDYATLISFYRDGTGDLLSVARSIRPFLEGLLRSRFPWHFQPNEWLGEFIEKIRNADTSSGLTNAKDDLPELEAINDFSKKYHHKQNPNADSEPISPVELQGFVKRTLRQIG